MVELNSQKVLVILGGTGKIGEAIVEYFLSLGWQIFSISRLQNPNGNTTNLEKEFPKLLTTIKADITNEKDLLNAMDFIKRKVKNINMLINCVGGLCKEEVLEEICYGTLKDVFDLNILSTINSCRIFKPLMLKGSTIINFSGGGATEDQANGAFISYSCAKAAVLRFTEIIANQLDHLKIRVFAIDPGWVPSNEDWKEINNPRLEHKIDKSFIRSAKETPILIEYLMKNNCSNLSGRLYRVFDNYQKIISCLCSTKKENDFLKLRLIAKLDQY